MAHLTIPAGEPLVSYTPGASSTGPFNVTFPIFSTSDLNVMVNGVLLTSSDWVFTSTDTRTGGYQAGYITLDSATTYEVVIYRDTTRSRTSDYASGPLDINTLNTDVDRTVARDQDLRMLIDRALRGPAFEGAIASLPAKALRASKALWFDANGDPTAIAGALSSVGVSAFMATVLDDLSGVAALNTLVADATKTSARSAFGLLDPVDTARGPILLNGDCAIDQPNAGASVAATGGVYCRDGLFIAKSGAGGFSWQRQTNANLLTARNPVITCDRYTVTAAAASPGAGDVYVADMRIEGLRASRLQYGRASARKAWLCATARASIACSIGFSLQNSAYDRSFPMSQALAANTTTDIALEVPGCTDGTWLTDNGVGLRLRMALGIGATGGGVAGAWASANKIGVAGAGLMATNGATLDITGWEIVVGDVAPGLYIPPDPALELLRCQREYEKSFAQSIAPAQNAGANNSLTVVQSVAAGATAYANLIYNTRKRATPSIATFNPNAANANWRCQSGAADAASLGLLYAGEQSCAFQFTAAAGSAAGFLNSVHWTADARL